MLCQNGKQQIAPNGSALFVCQKGVYIGKHCPFVKVCTKIMGYKMVDKIFCNDFIPK